MWSIIHQINLTRYLVVWKVNRSLVRLPRCLSVELSWMLGSIIAERLPTHQARPWRKALARWDGYGDDASLREKKKEATVPEAAWPVETVLFVYPGRPIYGRDELILWELKLIGNSADHGLFLEVILPAMEEAGSTTDPRWCRSNGLWGRFDIQAIYVARGSHWEPVARDGRLDLRYRVTPTQWAEGLTLGLNPRRTLDRLTWLTPFDFPPAGSGPSEGIPDTEGTAPLGTPSRVRQACPAPTLPEILESLAVRLSPSIPGKRHAPADVWNTLRAKDKASLRGAMEQAAQFPIRCQVIKPAPPDWPGRWIGTQTFRFIPDPIVPYLDLASILHIGRQTHFGCGTFVMA